MARAVRWSSSIRRPSSLGTTRRVGGPAESRAVRRAWPTGSVGRRRGTCSTTIRSSTATTRPPASPTTRPSPPTRRPCFRAGRPFANYTSYSRGINGVMIDIAGRRVRWPLTAADFQFRVGNDNTPGVWAAGPAPIDVACGPMAAAGSSRVT